MQDALAALDNREKATLIWVAIALLLALRSKSIRSSLFSLATTLASRQLLTIFAAMLSYVALVIFVAHQLELWDSSLLKDTLIWLLGPALVMLFGADQAAKDATFFKKTLIANLQVALVFEFLLNYYVLPLYFELLLVPIVVFVGVMLAFSETKGEHAPVKRLMQFIAAAIGLSLLSYATARLFGNVGSFVSWETLRLFALPVALTVLFLPFLYGFALFLGYETIFVQLKVWRTDPAVARFARRQILIACNLRLSRVNKFLHSYVARLPTIKTEDDATKLIADFNSGK